MHAAVNEHNTTSQRFEAKYIVSEFRRRRFYTILRPTWLPTSI